MEKDYLGKVVWIVLATILTLLALFWLPTINVGGWTMRKVDVFSDIRSKSALRSLADSDSRVARLVNADPYLAEMAAVEQPHVLEDSHLTYDVNGQLVTVEDSTINARAAHTVTREGVTSIIDMSEGANGGMASFYRALSLSGQRPVRIAVLGDSFIERDILTSMLRELLQQRFGGSGVGFSTITSIADQRPTVEHTYGGWTQHKAVDRHGYSNTYNNLTGNYFTASPNAWVKLEGKGRQYAHAASCTSSSFYFFGEGSSGYATAEVNGTDITHFLLKTSSVIAFAKVTGDINSVKWSVTNPGGTVFLGASMDSETGVIVDNFSMRAARGSHLGRISPEMLIALDQVRHYDLVIIMYGLNVAEKDRKSYDAYRKNLCNAVNNMKANMPGTSVLIVGCSDRAERRADNKLKTMNGVLDLIQAQKRVAIDTKVAFWNLYEAMGGEGSIVDMVKHGEANSDYTHINLKGGNRIARLLYDALMLGYENR